MTYASRCPLPLCFFVAIGSLAIAIQINCAELLRIGRAGQADGKGQRPAVPSRVVSYEALDPSQRDLCDSGGNVGAQRPDAKDYPSVEYGSARRPRQECFDF